MLYFSYYTSLFFVKLNSKLNCKVSASDLFGKSDNFDLNLLSPFKDTQSGKGPVL
jgi:hypothetical protein